MSDHETTAGENTPRISEATREAERRDAAMPADPGPEPTPDEAEAAERHEVDPAVAAANKEAVERGAAAKGEGRVP